MPIREIIRLPVTWVLSLLVAAISGVWTLSMLDVNNKVQPLKERIDRLEQRLDGQIEKNSKIEGDVHYLMRRANEN